jgi:hypothetical protein
LYDAGQHAEAARFFDDILLIDNERKDALHGRALCHLELEEFDKAKLSK